MLHVFHQLGKYRNKNIHNLTSKIFLFFWCLLIYKLIVFDKIDFVIDNYIVSKLWKL